MTLSKMFSAATAAAFLLGAAPVVAQEAPPAPPAPPAQSDAKPPHPHPIARFDGRMGAAARGASLSLDFGAGRKISVNCGAAPIAECIEAATPLIDKVAQTNPVERGAGYHGKKGPKERPQRMTPPPPPAAPDAAPAPSAN